MDQKQHEIDESRVVIGVSNIRRPNDYPSNKKSNEYIYAYCNNGDIPKPSGSEFSWHEFILNCEILVSSQNFY